MFKAIRRFFQPTIRWIWTRDIFTGQIVLTCPSRDEEWRINKPEDAWAVIGQRSEVDGWMKVRVAFETSPEFHSDDEVQS